MEKPASKSLETTASGDKRVITATFDIDLAGNFLSMQPTNWGRTDRSLPKVDFPKGFSQSVLIRNITAMRKKYKRLLMK